MTYAPVHQIRTHMMREAGSRFGWTDLRIWTRQQRSPIYRYSNIIKRSFGLWLAGLSRATFSPMQSRGEPTEDDSGTDSYPVATCLFSKRNNYGRAICRVQRRLGRREEKFPWCTANSLHPSHKSQRIQRSDWVRVWLRHISRALNVLI